MTEIFSPANIRIPIPFAESSVQAGYPSPVEEYVENRIDINDLFQVKESSSYYVRVEGLSMINEGIQPSDVLCVRRDLEARSGDIVVAQIDGEFTVKRYRKEGDTICFAPANDDFPCIVPSENQDVRIWAVVTGLARMIKRGRYV